MHGCRYYGEEFEDVVLANPVNALDLRNRGITSIADGGLGCYTMDTAMPPAGVGSDVQRMTETDILGWIP